MEVTVMDIKKIGVRALVTAVEATLGLLLAANLTDLTADKAETAVVAGIAAGASVVYNALRQYLDTTSV